MNPRSMKMKHTKAYLESALTARLEKRWLKSQRNYGSSARAVIKDVANTYGLSPDVYWGFTMHRCDNGVQFYEENNLRDSKVWVLISFLHNSENDVILINLLVNLEFTTIDKRFPDTTLKKEFITKVEVEKGDLPNLIIHSTQVDHPIKLHPINNVNAEYYAWWLSEGLDMDRSIIRTDSKTPMLAPKIKDSIEKKRMELPSETTREWRSNPMPPLVKLASIIGIITGLTIASVTLIVNWETVVAFLIRLFQI